MESARVRLYIELLEAARKQTLQVAEGVPESHRLRQIQAGKATPLWLLGHLANTISTVILEYLFQRESLLPRAYVDRFKPDVAGGLAPTTNPADYPPWDEVVALYNAVFDQAIALLGGVDDSVLEQPLPGEMSERARAFFTSTGFALGFMVTHDAYHRGQIGMLAKLP